MVLEFLQVGFVLGIAAAVLRFQEAHFGLWRLEDSWRFQLLDLRVSSGLLLFLHQSVLRYPDYLGRVL